MYNNLNPIDNSPDNSALKGENRLDRRSKTIPSNRFRIKRNEAGQDRPFLHTSAITSHSPLYPFDPYIVYFFLSLCPVTFLCLRYYDRSRTRSIDACNRALSEDKRARNDEDNEKEGEREREKG